MIHADLPALLLARLEIFELDGGVEVGGSLRPLIAWNLKVGKGDREGNGLERKSY